MAHVRKYANRRFRLLEAPHFRPPSPHLKGPTGRQLLTTMSVWESLRPSLPRSLTQFQRGGAATV